MMLFFQDAINWSVFYTVFHKIVFWQTFPSVYSAYYFFQDIYRKNFHVPVDLFSGTKPPQNLGMVSRQIHESQLTASSVYNDYHRTTRARLHFGRFGWRPANLDGSWFQVRSRGQSFKIVLAISVGLSS